MEGAVYLFGEDVGGFGKGSGGGGAHGDVVLTFVDQWLECSCADTTEDTTEVIMVVVTVCIM